MKKTTIKTLCSCFIAGTFITIALGCASSKKAVTDKPTVVTYNVSLKSVESPADAKVQFGETKITSLQDSTITKYSYEDDFIAITWYVDYRQFNFTLRNKSNHPIKINWDDISYVDYERQTSRVMHSGVKYNEKNSSQPSTMVPKGASLTDILLPTDNVYYMSGGYGGWQEKELIPRFIGKKDDADAFASSYVGKTMVILMPIYIKNVQNDYVFIFNIDSYSLR